MPELAAAVGLPLDDLPEADQNSIILALDHVLQDLAPHGLVNYRPGGVLLTHAPSARRFLVEPLTSIWPILRSGYLDAADDAFLVALAHRSEQAGVDRADVVAVDGRGVFDDLGWGWDDHRAHAIFGHLAERSFVVGREYGGPEIQLRITYAGLVRALDDTGALLREAEDHMQSQRLRAAGCVASVELERRLKLLAGPVAVSKRRDPQLEDYNKAAFEAGKIDQETWRTITTLAVIRKCCVHVLDREPKVDEVRTLIEGVERILRRYPAPTP
jgi:hypothetical protein